ncbi:MAG: hypothetical protein QOC77_3588 [Thermoleophilaceae bacterium]|jgi:hypothetical protein|nr:hypothetical protein [Thermoleophilaceae bacterium]MEA2470428.1 hypothetical protein [Thermoleophilaceae bacterium]
MSALGRHRRAVAAEPQSAGPPRELLDRREELSRRFAELQWDLGGLAYEMASRDHFRLDVIVRRAAELQEVDAELGEVERLLRLDDAGAAGTCPSCGALHSRGAVFCWQCGANLIERMAAPRFATPPPPPPPSDAELVTLAEPPPPPPPAREPATK